MFENIKDGYDSFRSKIKTGLDKRMEKGRLLVELAWVSGETAITGLKEGTSTGIHKVRGSVFCSKALRIDIFCVGLCLGSRSTYDLGQKYRITLRTT